MTNKKKIVMKVQMNCDKCRKKALKVAAGVKGVDSVTNEGKEMELLIVTGICVDAVRLASKMRKKVGCTELVSVEEVKPKVEKPEVKPKVDKPEVKPPCPPRPSCPPCVPPCPPCPCPQLVAYGTVYDPSPSICSIM